MAKTQDKAKARPNNAGFTKAGRNSRTGGKKRARSTSKLKPYENIITAAKTERAQERSLIEEAVSAAKTAPEVVKLVGVARDAVNLFFNNYMQFKPTPGRKRMSSAASSTYQTMGAGGGVKLGVDTACTVLTQIFPEIQRARSERHSFSTSF